MGEEKTLDELILTAQKTGQQEDVYKVHQAVLPFCYKVSKPFVSFGTLEKEEVEGIAYLSLVQALSVYDSEKGSFLNVLRWSLLRELTKLMNSTETLKISFALQMDLRKLRLAKAEYAKEHEGQQPDAFDLCASLQWDLKRLRKVEKASEKVFRLVYLNKPIQNEDGTECETGELIADQTAEFEQRILDETNGKQLAELVEQILQRLPESDAEIFRLRCLGEEKLTLDETAKRIGKPKETCRLAEIRARKALKSELMEKNFYRKTDSGFFRHNKTSAQEYAVLQKDRNGKLSNYLRQMGDKRNGTIRKTSDTEPF